METDRIDNLIKDLGIVPILKFLKWKSGGINEIRRALAMKLQGRKLLRSVKGKLVLIDLERI